jgi:hypothetical protein
LPFHLSLSASPFILFLIAFIFLKLCGDTLLWFWFSFLWWLMVLAFNQKRHKEKDNSKKEASKQTKIALPT